MTGRIFTADHHVYDLPELLAWNVTHTGTVPCDSYTVIIQVRDWGVGIKEEELPFVKEKFYKGSSKQRGSGIGLAVTDEIVRMHGGTLNIASTYGEGTQVTVTLPLANTDAKKTETKAIAADNGTQEE